jgi:peptidoglycan/xylan/chitin deacetylase (PgdA/CDA1 family)
MKRWITVCVLLLTLILPTRTQAAVPEAIEVSIIMYHKVTKDGGQLGKFAITPEEFEQDLQFLQDSDFTPVTVADLIRFVHKDGDLPARPVVLSFDDGYFGDYHYVLPLVKAYETPVVSSIIGKVTDEYTAEGRADIIYPHLTWSQVLEMTESGLIEIQNHSYDLHRSNGGVSGAMRRRGEEDTVYIKRLSEDLMKLQTRAEEMLGTAPSTFTYPFGAKSDGTDTILKELGFQASFMTEGKRNVITRGDADCLFSLGRIIRPHGRGLEEILAD